MSVLYDSISGDSVATATAVTAANIHSVAAEWGDLSTVEVGTGLGPVLRLRPGGTSDAIKVHPGDYIVQTGEEVLVMSSAKFFTLYLQNAPAVTAVSPDNGAAAGGTAVTVTGTDFDGATVVKFGATSATALVVVDTTTVTCVSPAHTAAEVDVKVTTPGGASPTAAGDKFTYS